MKYLSSLVSILLAGSMLLACNNTAKPLTLEVMSGPDNSIIKPPTGMVYIPPGKFIRGSNPDEEPRPEGLPEELIQSYQNETPRQEVFVDGYYIDRYEVTFREFRLFLDVTGRPAPKGWDNININHIPNNYPVFGISWEEADAYAEWAGKRLPTETEWEKAARGIRGRRYPWGNRFGKGFDKLLTRQNPAGERLETKSPFNVLDMAANVAEWTGSDFEAYSGSEYRDPNYGKGKKVVKGYYSTEKDKTLFPSFYYRAAARYPLSPVHHSSRTGFRCAMDVKNHKYDRPSDNNAYAFNNYESKMVYVPAGPFIMGTDKNKEEKIPDSYGLNEIPYEDETPQQKVYLDGFHIDRYEVTIGEFRKFLKAKNRPQPETWKEIDMPEDRREMLPVTDISWYEAAEYAAWLGKRLPTEEEWEKAARGTGSVRYLWGNNITKMNKENFMDMLVPVDDFIFAASPYGSWGMSGNAAEWTASWYEPYPGNKSPDKRYGKKYKVIRGGSYKQSGHYFINYYLRLACRDQIEPHKRYVKIGFRCVSDLPQKENN